MKKQFISRFGALLAATSFYAVVLQHYRRRIRHDWTWAEVVVGCAIVLLTARWIRKEWPEASGDEVEAVIWAAFIVGGLPIIIWQFWQRTEDMREAIEETAGAYGKG